MRVLVVQDDLRIAGLIKRGLEEERYVVDVVTTGPEAITRAGALRYDAAVVDVMRVGVEGMDGVEVCRQLSLGERTARVPVVVLTTRDSGSGRLLGFDAGADGYLSKPFSVDELSEQLDAVIRRGAGQRPTELRVADLRLDPGSRRAWRGKTELELSSKEFALLRLLMNHAGVMLTRRQIRDHVWDYDNDGGSNVVDQYVLYLRRKIDRPFQVQQVHTVRGAGYRLAEQPTLLSRPVRQVREIRR